MSLELTDQLKMSNYSNDESSSKQYQLIIPPEGTHTGGFTNQTQDTTLPRITRVWSLAQYPKMFDLSDEEESEADEPQPAIPVTETAENKKEEDIK